MTSSRFLRWAVAAMLSVGVLTACNDSRDELPAVVLQRADLPPVDSQTSSHYLPRRAICAKVSSAESVLRLMTSSARDDVWKGSVVQYTLESGDVVDSSVLPDNSSSDSPESMMDRVRAAIASCSSSTSETAPVEPLAGLEPAQTGYSYSYDSGAELVVGQRVFAVKGDKVVVVGAEHRGSGKLKVDVVKLLPKALDRAKNAPNDRTS